MAIMSHIQYLMKHFTTVTTRGLQTQFLTDLLNVKLLRHSKPVTLRSQELAPPSVPLMYRTTTQQSATPSPTNLHNGIVVHEYLLCPLQTAMHFYVSDW